MEATLLRSVPPVGLPASWLDTDEPGPRHAIIAYVLATPLLWTAGLLIPLGGLLLLWLVMRAGPRAALTPVVLVWLLVAGTQAVSVLVNGAGEDRSAGFVVYRLLSSGVTGWAVLGLALAVGARFRMARPELVRAVCVFGGYLVLFGCVALLLHSFTGLRELALRTPPAMLLPATAPVVEHSFTMHIFTTDDLLGRDLPRLVLFYPWPVVLGFAGIAVFFIAQLESNLPLRLLGSAGGLIAVLGSQGRAPILALFILLFVDAVLLRFDRRKLPLLGAAGILLLALLLPMGITPADIASAGYESVNEMRPGSSMARELVNTLSIAGFLESPVFGKGWVGGVITTGATMVVGTHSSFYGLLYTGGLVTFLAFLTALATTLIVLARRVGRGPIQRTGLLIMLGLALLSYGEGVYSFALPCVPLLLFVGGTLRDDAQPAARWRTT